MKLLYALDERQQLQLGHEAKQLLENDTLALAFQAVEHELLDQIANSEPQDMELREFAYAQLQALRQLRQTLAAAVLSVDLSSNEETT